MGGGAFMGRIMRQRWSNGHGRWFCLKMKSTRHSAALDNGLNVTAPQPFLLRSSKGLFHAHRGKAQSISSPVVSEKAAAQTLARQVESQRLVKARRCRKKVDYCCASGESLGQGESKDGMVKFTFGRPATMHGVKIDNTMGLNTWVAFAGSDDNAVVDGDFAVTEDELQPTAKSLLKEKINIVAIHQHMTHEQPRMMFFHYWGRGRAKDLAQAIKGAFLVAGLQEVTSPIHN
jgi:hypothetical protein